MVVTILRPCESSSLAFSRTAFVPAVKIYFDGTERHFGGPIARLFRLPVDFPRNIGYRPGTIRGASKGTRVDHLRECVGVLEILYHGLILPFRSEFTQFPLYNHIHSSSLNLKS